MPTRIPEGQRRDFRFEFFGSVVERPLRPLLEENYYLVPPKSRLLDLFRLEVIPTK